MSISAKTFVSAPISSKIPIMQKVVSKLNEYVRDLLDTEVKKQGFQNRYLFLHNENNRKIWSNGCNIQTRNFESFSIYFGIGEARTLFVSWYAHDYSDVCVGEKIVFSLGYFGKSDEIMNNIIPVLKEFGDVFYDFNDCDNQDFIKQ